MANPQYVYHMHKLSKTYPGGKQVLKDISLSFFPGAKIGVLGLNGSGKSTLLRCINRLIDPTSGRIVWNDIDISAAAQDDLRLIRRRIGMIFQHFNLVKRSRVTTNVLAGRLGYTNPAWSLVNRFSKEDVQLAMRNLKRVGITDQAYKRADELSGGQQQRVGIARALMQNPELMLVDEPVSALDPATSHSIMRYLEELNKKDGMTILCSLHFLSLARTYADRIIALKDGSMVFDGSPKEIDDARFREIYGEEAEQVEIR